MGGVTACIRGCANPRRHADGCDNTACRGCEPTKAEHGRLCYTCHSTLRELLRHAHGQVALLRAMVEPSDQWALTVPTTYRPRGPRTDASAVDYIGIAHATATSEGGEALRADCLDVAQEIEDLMSQWVEALCEQTGATGPRRMPPRRAHRSWHESLGGYITASPTVRFELRAGADWLVHELALLEEQEWIGDDLEVFCDLMSRAHSLCPWREEATPLRGVPCPACQRCSVVLPGGSSDVKCLTCRRCYPWERWAIWVKMVEFEANTA